MEVRRLKEGGVSSEGGGGAIKILKMILGWNNIGLEFKLRGKITKKILWDW